MVGGALEASDKYFKRNKMIKEDNLKFDKGTIHGILREIKEDSIDVVTKEEGLLNIEADFGGESIRFLQSNINREILFVCTFIFHANSGYRIRIVATDIISNEL